MYLAHFLYGCVGLSIHEFKLVGVFIIIVAGIKGVIKYIKRESDVRLQLALGLEFRLGSEILRTVIVREFTEIALVVAIIKMSFKEDKKT